MHLFEKCNTSSLRSALLFGWYACYESVKHKPFLCFWFPRLILLPPCKLQVFSLRDQMLSLRGSRNVRQLGSSLTDLVPGILRRHQAAESHVFAYFSLVSPCLGCYKGKPRGCRAPCPGFPNSFVSFYFLVIQRCGSLEICGPRPSMACLGRFSPWTRTPDAMMSC